MSATNRGAIRHKDDFYETPAWCTEALLEEIRRPVGDVLDLGCGKGAIGRVIQSASSDNSVLGVDINPDLLVSCPFPTLEHNALTLELNNDAYFDLVVMNPPYKLSMEFVQRGLMLGICTAALLRLNWLASKSRAAFHKKFPSDVLVLPKRPSFTEDGKTDATEYAWFVWGPGRGGRWKILDTP